MRDRNDIKIAGSHRTTERQTERPLDRLPQRVRDYICVYGEAEEEKVGVRLEG